MRTPSLTIAALAAVLALGGLTAYAAGPDGKPRPTAEQRQADYFAKADTNKDGAISPEEFKASGDVAMQHMIARMEKRLAQLKAMTPEARHAKAAARFTKMDVNKDGKLEQNEWALPIRMPHGGKPG